MPLSSATGLTVAGVHAFVEEMGTGQCAMLCRVEAGKDQTCISSIDVSTSEAYIKKLFITCGVSSISSLNLFIISISCVSNVKHYLGVIVMRFLSHFTDFGR